MSELNETVARWFEARRGIKPETVAAFGIFTDGRDIVFPYPDGMLKRRYSIDADNPFGLEKEGRRFKWEDADGNSGQAGQVPYLPPDFEQRERMILIPDGETDTLALWQNLPDSLRDKVSVVGLSGVGSWKDKYAEELFGEAKRVFVQMDNDDPYTSPDAVKSVEGGWQKIRASLGKKARRVKLPQGQKDLAEFFMAYDWAAYEVLLKAAAQPRRYYPRLDLSKPAPPTDWLVKDLFVMGEVTVLAGDSGSGKSLILQALAKAVAAGDEKFLARELRHHGPVVYVDEENTVALILQRLQALGLHEEHHGNIDYISSAGVNLFTEPELLLEEVIDIEPVLITLDSQSALSLGSEENDQGDMTKLYKTAIRPLARETGAAVVVLHHTPKDGQLPRGSGAIKAQADQVLSVVPAETGGGLTGRLNIFAQKERRQTDMVQVQFTGSIEHDGWIRVEAPGEDVM